MGEKGEVGEPGWVEVGEVAAGEGEVGVDVGLAVAGELQRVAVGGAFPAAERAAPNGSTTSCSPMSTSAASG